VKEGEVTLVLDYPEREAAPLQRTWYRHHVRTNLVGRQVALIDRYELDVGRIVDGVPDELSIAGVLEPTAEGVVPTEVRVDGVIHGSNIAPACHLTAGDDLPGKVQPRCRPFAVVTKMLALHVADGDRADLCLA